MARTALTPQTIKTPFDVPAANEADVTYVAADVANGNSFPCTGRELLLVWNDGGAAPYYVTLTSAVDEKGRTEDITQYDVGIDEVAAFTVGMTNSKGWKDAGGNILIDTENVALKLAVLRLPQGR